MRMLRSHWFKSNRISTYDSFVDAAGRNLRQYHGSVSCVCRPHLQLLHLLRASWRSSVRQGPVLTAAVLISRMTDESCPLWLRFPQRHSSVIVWVIILVQWSRPDSSPSSSANTSCWSVFWFKKKKREKTPPTEAVTTPSLTHLHLICNQSCNEQLF